MQRVPTAEVLNLSVGFGNLQDFAFGGKALDVMDHSSANGAPIQQWSYLNGNNQQWMLVALGSNEFKIVSLLSGKVLDVAGGPQSTGNGVFLQQWDYIGGNNQKFSLSPIR